MTWSPPKKPIIRRPGWETRLVTRLGQVMNTPFEWGVSDCIIQQAEICQAMTGVQFLPARFRTYRSATGAQKLLLKNGFTSVEQLLDATFERVPVAKARRGDCVLIPYPAPDGFLPGGDVAATLFGQFACTRTARGPLRVASDSLTIAWRIG